MSSNGLRQRAITPTRHIFGSTIAHIPTLTHHPKIHTSQIHQFLASYTPSQTYFHISSWGKNITRFQIHPARMSHGHRGVLLRDIFAFAGGERLKGLRICVDGWTNRTRIGDSSHRPCLPKEHTLYGPKDV